MSSADWFRLPHYQRHNQRRQEHLATLGLPFRGRSVLEVGAGIGDHTGFLVDRECRVTSTDGRDDLLQVLRERYPAVKTMVWDVEQPAPAAIGPHDVVYCYGLLYHTRNPDEVIAALSHLAREFMVLETCVSFGAEPAANLVAEDAKDPTQALSGTGCRPTRSWVMGELRKHFPHVYVTRFQPWHDEFPVDWRDRAKHAAALSRAVFVAARAPLDERTLSRELLDLQERA